MSLTAKCQVCWPHVSRGLDPPPSPPRHHCATRSPAATTGLSPASLATWRHAGIPHLWVWGWRQQEPPRCTLRAQCENVGCPSWHELSPVGNRRRKGAATHPSSLQQPSALRLRCCTHVGKGSRHLQCPPPLSAHLQPQAPGSPGPSRSASRAQVLLSSGSIHFLTLKRVLTSSKNSSSLIFLQNVLACCYSFHYPNELPQQFHSGEKSSSF